MTNAGADDEEMVSFNDVVEWYLLSPLSVKEMPHLEDAVPGFTAALVRWSRRTTGRSDPAGEAGVRTVAPAFKRGKIDAPILGSPL